MQVNEALATMLGYRVSELEGRSFAEFIHSDEAANHSEAVRALLTGESRQRFETRYLRRDGGFEWVDANVAAVRDAGGKLSTSSSA